MDIKGHTVHRVLVDPGADIQEEYYVSYLLDRADRTFLAMASYEGGMEIEQLAVERPEALAKVPVDAHRRRRRGQGPRDRGRRGLPGRGGRPGRRRPGQAVGRPSSASDATLVEVNPLAKIRARMRGGAFAVVALDGKVTLDENASFRQPGNADLADAEAGDPLEARAKAKDLNYVKLDGEVGHHRQRCRPGHVDPGRRRLRR